MLRMIVFRRDDVDDSPRLEEKLFALSREEELVDVPFTKGNTSKRLTVWGYCVEPSLYNFDIQFSMGETSPLKISWSGLLRAGKSQRIMTVTQETSVYEVHLLAVPFEKGAFSNHRAT
jgi:hypothetical protein